MPTSVEVTKLLAIVNSFLTDARLYLILGLIALDLVLGIADAIKCGEFEWAKVADFYRSKVVPMTLGYFALYLAFMYVAGLDTVLGQTLVTAALAPLIASLTGDILGKFKDIYGTDGKPA